MFPNSIERGDTAEERARLGIAGPNASDGLTEVHEAAGLPSMIIDLQEEIGTKRTPIEWEPEWNISPPSVQQARFARFGPFVWINIYAAWQYSVRTDSSLFCGALPDFIQAQSDVGGDHVAARYSMFNEPGIERMGVASITPGGIFFRVMDSGGALRQMTAQFPGVIRVSGVVYSPERPDAVA